MRIVGIILCASALLGCRAAPPERALDGTALDATGEGGDDVADVVRLGADGGSSPRDASEGVSPAIPDVPDDRRLADANADAATDAGAVDADDGPPDAEAADSGRPARAPDLPFRDDLAAPGCRGPALVPAFPAPPSAGAFHPRLCPEPDVPVAETLLVDATFDLGEWPVRRGRVLRTAGRTIAFWGGARGDLNLGLVDASGRAFERVVALDVDAVDLPASAETCGGFYTQADGGDERTIRRHDVGGDVLVEAPLVLGNFSHRLAPVDDALAVLTDIDSGWSERILVDPMTLEPLDDGPVPVCFDTAEWSSVGRWDGVPAVAADGDEGMGIHLLRRDAVCQPGPPLPNRVVTPDSARRHG